MVALPFEDEHHWPIHQSCSAAAAHKRETAMPRHADVIAAAVSRPKLAKCPSGNLGLNTITGGTSRRNWSATGKFPCFLP